MSQVAVCSKSFSKNKVLREELLKKYPNTKFNDQGKDFSPEELVSFLAGCEKAIVGLEKINESLLQKLPALRVIAKYGVGLDALDFAAMKKFKIKLGWTAGVNKRSVAELAIGHMIACLRHLYVLNQEVKSGKWQVKQGAQLSGKKVGLIGLGNVGQDLTPLLRAFGCQVLANDIADRGSFASQNQVQMMSLQALLQQSDIVSVHVPLDSGTRNLLNQDNMSQMKPTSILINTARGNIVDQKALLQLLKDEKIGAAAFDVFDVEPPSDRELIDHPRFYISPHIGGSSMEAVLAMGRAAILGLDSATELKG